MKAPNRITFNKDLCAGCASCEMACSAVHFGKASRYLSAIRLDADFYNHNFEIHVCKQCKSPSCMDACPKSAIKIDETTGAKYIDRELCVKCGLCVKACPFADEAFPLIYKADLDDGKVIVKCDLCKGREKGPACVEICYYGALQVK